MEITLHSSVTDILPDFKLGIIEYNNITVGPSPSMLRGRLQLFQESIYFDLKDQQVTDRKGINEWRQVFKSFGKDPSRYRPSSESLYRRIQKENYLSSIHSAVDLNNFFSLQYESPIGIYDSSKLNGPIQITVGSDKEVYTALNGRDISLENLIISKDKSGPFGSPYVDSNRAPVTESTKSALQIIYLPPSLLIEEANKLTESLKNMFIQLHGGNGTHFILTK
ncbi:tRNA synthetase subunit beta [Bacillus coahuilensis m2-6]|uniref:tRNA synthetase subunit beta n=1 Tax=Bacillus coahuilensis p1.1.43 TaxID=1150625 RepID=A0A147KBE4_9BACI|nr:phenylalanine--tRNA ligase beta subunit-related protein [Bacillus coahuilensis]KUP08477.1 tRNA synthetase subunit beta [Bacillus coahuilensis p1.1.43]KUP09600.1 tRNA synthetase subunit beta [Bacillus coahuilensis m2-6]